MTPLNRYSGHAAIALLALLIVLAVLSIRQELEVDRWTTLLVRQQSALARGEPSPGAPVENNLKIPRAQLLRAMYLLRAAEVSSDPEDAQRLRSIARRDLETARAARPIWGDAATVLAYARTLENPVSMSAVASALSESYRDAPYVKDVARWRIETGLWCWQFLPAPARERLVAEAVWYVRLRPHERVAIFRLMRLSPAYQPFLLAWHAVRSEDSDWGRDRAPTPALPRTSRG